MSEINWERYAIDYDVMCEANPAYQQNVQHLLDRLDQWQLPASPKVLDIGAGTGSFIVAMSEKLSDAQFTHLDFNAAMNAQALNKYTALGIDIDIVQGALADLDMPNYSQDLIICVNALYAMSQPQAVLRRIRRLLKPNGRFFVIDFGREMRVVKWSYHLYVALLQQQGARGAAKWFWRNREVLRQNRIGMRAQQQGNYWLHSPRQFAYALESNGWYIEEITTCYLGDCDLAVCRPF